MMKCKIIEDLLPLYLDDACSRESREVVEEHLEECADCRAKLEQMQRNLEPQEQEIEINMQEEKLLENGKNAFVEEAKEKAKKEVKKDLLHKAVLADIPINLAITVGFVFKICTLDYSDVTREAVAFLLPAGIVVATFIPVMFLIWEIVFLVKDNRGKDTFVSQMIAMTSILLKLACLVIANIIGIVLALQSFFSM